MGGAMSIVLAGSTSGTITLQEPAVAGTNTISLPASTGTMMVNGPAFSAYAGSGTTVATATFTKINFDTEEFDTNSNFASSRFTPTVAGYYQISSGITGGGGTTGTNNLIMIYKNGSWYRTGSTSVGGTYFSISNLVYLNGSTDYVEIYLFQNSGLNFTTGTTVTNSFAGVLVRSA
jgi:hypothetical protein